MTKNEEGLSEKTVVTLKREIGLFSAVNFLINVIIGSGIWVTPGKVLAECGSVGLMMTVWVVCGIVTFLTCLPFGELSTVVPKSGSIYIYLYSAFSDSHKFFGGLPAFVYFWISYVIANPCSAAVNARLFSEYTFKILELFLCDAILNHETAVKYALGTSALVLVGVINCISVKLYIKSQNLLTALKMAAIIFTMGCGVYLFSSGKANDFDPGFRGSNWSIKGITQALYLGLYAYDGGWAITGITEELQNPEKNILASIMISLVITTITYLSLNITFLTALTTAEMSSGSTVIADFAEKIFGVSGATIAAAIIALCLLTSLMCSIFYNSRMGFVAAREGHIAECLCYIHKPTGTPAPAILVQVLLSLAFFFIGGDVTELIDIGSFFMWISYGVTMMTIFVFRKKFPEAYRPFKVFWLVPIMVAGVACYLFVVSIMVTPIHLILMVPISFVFMTIVYYIFIYKEFRIKHFDKWQLKMQTSLKLVPPTF